jgi:DNA-binding IclR family transcriptional regulator
MGPNEVHQWTRTDDPRFSRPAVAARAVELLRDRPIPVGSEVRSVDRAASILVALGEMPGEAGVTELAHVLDLHKSTVSRLLATLQKHGLVDRNAQSGRYRLGLAFVRLGSHAEKSLDLKSIARTELDCLAEAVKETATLEILEDDSVRTLACSNASGSGRDRTGRTSPLHATAPGKILLASRPEREIIRLSRVRFTPYTSNTITRVDALLEELARVRKRGFSTAFGEHEPSVSAVAVPVFDQRAGVVAAIQVLGPVTRVTAMRVPELVDRAMEAAAKITNRIGGVVASQ